VTEADPCRRVLSLSEDAALFAEDALGAAGRVMAGRPAGEADAAYAVLAAAALGQDRRLCGARPGGLGTESVS
jgi:hypothetical protein